MIGILTARDAATRRRRAEVAVVCGLALICISMLVIAGQVIGSPAGEEPADNPILIDPYYVYTITPLVVIGLGIVTYGLSKNNAARAKGKARRPRTKPRRRKR